MSIKLSLQKIESLRNRNLTLPRLAILFACDQPLTFTELENKAGVTKRCVEKFIKEDDGYLKRTTYYDNDPRKGKERRGRRTLTLISRTKKGDKVLQELTGK